MKADAGVAFRLGDTHEGFSVILGGGGFLESNRTHAKDPVEKNSMVFGPFVSATPLYVVGEHLSLALTLKVGYDLTEGFEELDEHDFNLALLAGLGVHV